MEVFMKRIVSLLLALCLLTGVSLTLASCEMFDTPETMVTKAVAKTEMQDSYAATMIMNMSMKVMGESMDMKTELDMKVQNPTSDDIKAEMVMDMNLYGTQVSMTSYADKEWTYVVMDGAGYKQKNEEDPEMAEQIESIMKELPKDVFEGVEIVKSEDGTRSVTIEIPDDVFVDVYADLIASMTESMGETTDVDCTIRDAVVVISVKDGLISNYDIDFVLLMTMYDVTVDADVEASITFTQYGGVEVVFPEGCENFPEQTE